MVRYRRLFENLIDVSYQTDQAGNFIVISPSAKDLFGYAPEEVLGAQIANFYKVPQRRQEFLQLLRDAGQVKNFEADPTQIHQIVLNLCTNAYHALKNEVKDLWPFQSRCAIVFTRRHFATLHFLV